MCVCVFLNTNKSVKALARITKKKKKRHNLTISEIKEVATITDPTEIKITIKE